MARPLLRSFLRRLMSLHAFTQVHRCVSWHRSWKRSRFSRLQKGNFDFCFLFLFFLSHVCEMHRHANQLDRWRRKNEEHRGTIASSDRCSSFLLLLVVVVTFALVEGKQLTNIYFFEQITSRPRWTILVGFSSFSRRIFVRFALVRRAYHSHFISFHH